MTYDLRRKVINLLADIDCEVDQLMEEFKAFTDGCRVMILLQRTKDGGNNHEERRTMSSRVSYSPEQFKNNLREMLLLQHIDERPLRLYLSVNDRNVNKIIRHIKHELIDSDYIPEDQKENMYKKLLRSPKHFLMQPQNKKDNLFILDVDNEDGRDAMGEALQRMQDIGITEVLRYKTKNGWHIVVKPFNIALWFGPGEVKKDGLLLLKY